MKRVLFGFLVSIAAIFSIPSYTQEIAPNLIEYGMGEFSDCGLMSPPSLWPPIISIREDGRTVLYREDHFIIGKHDDLEIAKIRKRLSKNKLLKKSQLIPLRRGKMLGIGGGIVYIRYKDNDEEIIVCTTIYPNGGSFKRLIDEILGFVPKITTRFYPTEMNFWVDKGADVCEDQIHHDVPPWPFGKKTSLALLATISNRSDKWIASISDEQMIRYFFDNLAPSWACFSWDFCEDGKRYYLTYRGSSNWAFEQSRMANLLFEMYDNWCKTIYSDEGYKTLFGHEK
jgi:hypothetical protein